ncbi:hypothetical protein [Psychrobacillus sp.]|uniref:Rgg family transcriptional regulator n=1 Tax=Psychrobacillus sp. TaxID=1871623 RepID=UPI0028BD2A05|nr:hypothetical protein [Psychrobacillus sp.]
MKIREGKGFSQRKVSIDILHQSNCSKFEQNKVDISYKKFVQLLERVHIELEEFEFISNNYSYPPKKWITLNFFAMKLIDVEKLKKIIRISDIFLEEHEDELILDIRHLAEAFICIQENNDFDAAKKLALRVWKRLKEYDTWHLNELQLINCLLYLFDIETATFITKFALKQLQKYSQHPLYQKIKIPFNYNLTLLFIQENKLQEANLLNEKLITEFKELAAYNLMTCCYARKHFLSNQLNQPIEINYLQKAYSICDALDNDVLKQKIINEMEYFSTLDFKK